MNDKVKTKALRTLDGVEQIVRMERLVHGDYATRVEDPTRAGQLCGGRRYCLMGSVWVAHGIKPEDRSSRIPLPGISPRLTREAFTRRRPALRAVVEALDRAAERRIKNLRYSWQRRIEDDWAPAEGYFEVAEPGRSELLRLVASARKIIEKA